MKKMVSILVLVTLMCYGAGLMRDMDTLHAQMIRLHVVGASNDAGDQAMKLQVKDAVNQYLGHVLRDARSPQEAKAVLTERLSQIRAVAEAVLREQGSKESVQVSLGQEAFPTREYDTFTLPAGVYESLRIRIGSASGKNWWCVVFPSLCLPAGTEELRDTAAGAGFSDDLCDTITGEAGYEIRFFLLDMIGQLQNLWFQGN